MAYKIAILITSFFRNDLLEKALHSIAGHLPQDACVLVADQGNLVIEDIKAIEGLPCIYFKLPFNCGLSYARNYLVDQAKALEIPYIVLSADSLIFNEQTKRVIDLIPCLQDFDLIGMHTTGNKVYWVGDLKLIERKYFEVSFADRMNEKNYVLNNGVRLMPCTCVENFFIAKTETIADVRWDDNLPLAEHEDFLYRYGQKYKMAWTDHVSCDYIRTRLAEHGKYRDENWRLGQTRLIAKYGLETWIKYRDLQLGKLGTEK